MKKVACHDLIPGCPFTASAENEKQLLEQVAAHARDSHGVKEVSPELADKLKRAVKG